MIECASCHTLNPDSEGACLMCGLTLPAALRPGSSTLRCPAGHPIDPSWHSCPYCDRKQTGEPVPSSRATRLEVTAAGSPQPAGGMGGERQTRLDIAFPSSPAQPSPPGAPRATRLEMTPQAPRRTVLAEAPPVRPGSGAAPVAAAQQPVAGRRLVGVLAAPALGQGGSVFAVRQGKNMIGSDRASEICLSADPGVSLEHALLLHRGDSFYLADRMSTNGTWVNDAEVPANGTVVLRDRDRIRCGGVDLIFLTLERAADSSADAAEATTN